MGTAASRKEVLRIRQLQMAYGGHVVFCGADAEACEGEIVILRGDNGSGKTTLLNILTGNLQPSSGFIHLDINGGCEMFVFPRPFWRRLTGLGHFAPERLARAGLGRSWQELRLFRTQTVRENLSVAVPRQLGENPLWPLVTPWRVNRQEAAILRDCERRIAEVELTSVLGTEHVDSLSLGQAKRVGVARALNAEARILFLDEPLAGLDRQGRIAIVRLLANLVASRRLTVFVVEHPSNIGELLPFATRVWTIHDGLISQQVGPGQKEAHTTVGSVVEKHWLFGSDGPAQDEAVDLGAGGRLTIARSIHGQGQLPLLEAREMTVSRRGRFVIGGSKDGSSKSSLTLVLRPGDIALLEAPNGWGKTTLLEALAGLLPLSSGMVRLAGRDITAAPPWVRRSAGISFLRAEFNSFPALSVRECLSLAGVRESPPDLQRFLPRRVDTLSGGEQQRVALAIATMGAGCTVAVLDEPFSSLDAQGMAVWRRRVLADAQHRATLIAVPSA